MESVILIAQDRMGEKMAGPAIRSWEMAKALAKKRKVFLLTQNPTELSHPNVTLLPYSKKTYSKLLSEASSVISQYFNPLDVMAAKRANVPLIFDAYDPIPVESLEYFKYSPMEKRNDMMQRVNQNQLFVLHAADFILTATERQRDLLTGTLLSMKRITPALYDKDPTLNSLIGTVPFGISSKAPVKSGPGLKEKFHFRDKDKLFLWGGGVWNWFDPLSLLHAMAKIREKRSDIHLIFMGLKHPNDAVPDMKMTKDAIDLAKQLKLMDKTVHFNFGWTPYEERQNFLLDATAGVSMHFENLETRYSFRTRLLDCLWAKLPMLVTKGDYFADLIEQRGLGLTVNEKNEEEIARAIETLADTPSLREKMQENIALVREDFYWERVIEPIERFLESPKSPSKMGIMPYLHFTKAFIQERGLVNTAKALIKRLALST